MRLTNRQLDILRGYAAGYTSRQLAAQLGITLKTVQVHRHTLYQIFGVHSKQELLHKGILLSLIQAPSIDPQTTTLPASAG